MTWQQKVVMAATVTKCPESTTSLKDGNNVSIKLAALKFIWSSCCGPYHPGL